MKRIVIEGNAEMKNKNWFEEQYPPRIEYSEEKGIAYVSVYEDKTSSFSNKEGYQTYTFIRNKKGKWKYKSEKKLLFIILFLAPVLIIGSTTYVQLGFGDDIVYYLKAVLIWAVLVFGFCQLEAHQARNALNDFLERNEKKKKGTTEKNEKQKKNEEYKYENISIVIKCIVNTIKFLFWLVIFGLFMIVLIGIGPMFGSGLRSGDFFESVVLGAMLLVHIMVTCSWARFLKMLMGNYSCSVPIGIAKGQRKYAPEKILAKLRNNRRNVIYLKNKQGMVQIYGAGEAHVLEVAVGDGDDFQVFHMIDYDPEADETTIMPLTDETTTIVENRWHEKFPVRKCWLVNEDRICDFLRKLYECKDLQAAMEGVSFAESTEETKKLISANAYIIPEVPVDWPVGGIKSNMGAEWMRKKDKRVKRALEILSQKKGDQ